MTDTTTKVCQHCGEAKPVSKFGLSRHGTPRPYCKPCRSRIETERYYLKQGLTPEQITARHAEHARAKAQHADRIARDREARAARTAAREARTAAREAQRSHRAFAAAAQAAMLKGNARLKAARRKGRKIQSPEEMAANAERVSYLTDLLLDRHPTEIIANQQSWDAAMAEVQHLWLLSGDRQCTACGETVQPEEMFPPGRANFYPGKCKACAHQEAEGHSRRAFGPLIGPLRGPRRFRQRDGTFVSLGVIARRVRECAAQAGHLEAA